MLIAFILYTIIRYSSMVLIGSLDLGTQTTILSGLVHGMKSADIHIQTGASHSTIERMHSRLRAHIADYMDKKQEEIGFGPGYVDVEVDEVPNSVGLGDALNLRLRIKMR